MKNKTDRFYQQLLTTVFPLVIQAFMLALVSATDAVMLGLVDQTSMSSVSLGGQVQFVLNLFVLGITGGLSILTAQYWGKGDHEVVERLIPRNLLYMLLIGGLFTLGAALAPGLIMRLLTNDAQLIACGQLQFLIYGNSRTGDDPVNVAVYELDLVCLKKIVNEEFLAKSRCVVGLYVTG